MASGNPLMKYTELLGTCWGNFNSLELMIRVFLLKQSGASESGLDLNVGDTCPETPMTDYRQFRELAADFSAKITRDPRLQNIDQIAMFRDAMAHGRVLAKGNVESELVVYKFSRPDKKAKTVSLEVKQNLSFEFLREVNDCLLTNMFAVNDHIRGLEKPKA